MKIEHILESIFDGNSFLRVTMDDGSVWTTDLEGKEWKRIILSKEMLQKRFDDACDSGG